MLKNLIVKLFGKWVIWVTIKWNGISQLAIRDRIDHGDDFFIVNPKFLEILSTFKVGNRVFINYGLTLMAHAKVVIEDEVMIAPNVSLLAVGHNPDLSGIRARESKVYGEILIKSGVWIGAGVIILPGVTIGKNSVIGAGSVVTKDIPPNVIAVGNPCRVIRHKNKL